MTQPASKRLVTEATLAEELAAIDAEQVGADVAGAAAAAQGYAVQRANHTGNQAAGTITGLAGVATSGAYNDLSGKPTIPAVAADVGAEALRTSISIPAALLTATQGTPGGMSHYGGVPVFSFRTTTGDERASAPPIDIPGNWATFEVEVQYVNLTTTAQAGDVRWRYEEDWVDSPTASPLALAAVVGIVDTAQAAGVRRSITLITGRAIDSSRRIVVGLTRTNSNVADTLNDAVGVLQIVVRKTS